MNEPTARQDSAYGDGTGYGPGLLRPGGGTAIAAGVLTLLFTVMALAGLLTGVLSGIGDPEVRVRWWGLLLVLAAVALAGLGFHGGVQLLRGRREGQLTAAVFSGILLLIAIAACFTQGFNYLPLWSGGILLLTLCGPTSRWLEYKRLTRHH